jgi:hypothetical protein
VDNVVLLAFGLAVCSFVAGLVFVLGSWFRWSKSQRSVVAAASVVLTVMALFCALIIAYLQPIEAYSMQWKLRVLERNLYVGESRRDIESQFGHTIPKPDSFSGYSVPAAEAVSGWGDHLGQYSYAAGGGFCVQWFQGIVVFYNVHDRVKSWKHFESGVGC